MAGLNPNHFWNFVESGDWQLAIRRLTQDIDNESSDGINAINFFNRGTCLLAMHQLDAALADFQKAYELHPDETEGHTQLDHAGEVDYPV